MSYQLREQIEELATELAEERTLRQSLEATVEGLETQLHDAEGVALRLSEDMEKLETRGAELVELHERRYARAIKMIGHRQERLELQRKAYVVLARQYKELADKHSQLSVRIAELNNSVRDLHNVNIVDLDDAISALANAIDTALLS